jgi:hypothetical protein
MNIKANKKFIVIIALILVNAVGFTSARYYFAQHIESNQVSTNFFQRFNQASPDMINPSKFLEFGIDLLKYIGK